MKRNRSSYGFVFFNFIKKLTDTSIFIGKEQKTVSKDKGEFGFQKADKG